MNVAVHWNSGLQFMGTIGEHEVLMDTVQPLGNDTGASPKQLLLMAICGCSGMDVVSILKKHEQTLESFALFTSVKTRETQPKIYTDLHITYELEGQLETKHVLDAVQLSMSRFCSVSAMVSKVINLTYSIEVNGVLVGEGKSNFEI
jgi:putative redox protein